MGRQRQAEPPVLTLAEEMKPLLLVMRAINIMPMHFTADGGAYFSWRSSMMLLSAAGWAVTFVDVAYETKFRIDLFVSNLGHFSESVFNTFFFLLLHHHYFTPVLHWPAAPRFADYLADWALFQRRYVAVTGQPLRLAVRSLALHKGLAALLVPLAFIGTMGVALDNVNWHNLPLGYLAAVFHASVPAFWDVLGTAAVNTSDQMARHFQQEVAAADGAPPAARVREYRELWLDLRSLAERAPAAWGICTLHYMVCCISAVLLNGFGLLAEATQGAAADPIYTTGMFLVMVDSLWHTAVVCAAGQRMAASVGGDARDVLLAMRVATEADGKPGRLQAPRRALQAEVRSFLNLMRRPPVISLHGFMTLKVSLIVTIVETLTTYLCVLLQFTINFQAKEHAVETVPEI